MKKVFNSYYFKIGVLAILVRFLIMPFFGHEDIKLIHWASLNIFTKGISSVYLTEKSVYPPTIYLLSALTDWVLQPFLGNQFREWLNLGMNSAFQSAFVFRNYFFMKLPYVLFDFIAAFSIVRFFNEDSLKKKGYFLWLFNPVNLYVTYALGQFDLIPTALVVLSLVLFYRNWKVFSLILMGVAATFKMFPLFFILPMVLLLRDGFRKKIVFLFLGVLPFLLSTVPFIKIPAFYNNVLFSVHTQSLQNANFYIGGDLRIYLFFVIYTIFVLWIAYFGKKEDIWRYFLSITLLYYALSFFHAQWFLWGIPFLVIWWILDKRSRGLQVLFYLFYLGIVLLFEPTMNIGLLRPIDLIFGNIHSLGEFIGSYADINNINGYLHSAIAGFAFFMIYLLILRQKETDEK